ncbi:S-adenosyl-L-methionine-dependent methyltransferase [Tothia fuscella]|uniref:catechol O-methyltransferase n=1 Tax=Tothia fuscella TaxID=1048955 RepID=A0A9P4NQM3_9PEZI|nr:S-adenosyl-L-methionine-dependent methyltransferase [Tothia fuscella]
MQFDPQDTYIKPTEHYQTYDDGRELDLLYFIHNDPDIENMRGNPLRILDAIDDFARTREYLMNIGRDKGRIIGDLIREIRPRVMVELGGYVGYSTILLAHLHRQCGGSHYYTLEQSPEFAAVLLSLVDLAGLSSFVTVLVGEASRTLQRLQANGTLSSIDLLFLDHNPEAHLPDLKLCESLNLVNDSNVVIANNGMAIQHREYWGGGRARRDDGYTKYIRGSVEWRREAFRFEQWQKEWFRGNNSDVLPTLSGKPTRQIDSFGYTSQPTETYPKTDITYGYDGNPNLVYDTSFVRCFDPTGLEVSLLAKISYKVWC